MMLGNAAGARVRLVVWCRKASIRSSPAPAEMARQHGSETVGLDRRKKLVCSRYEGWAIDMVLSRTARG
jgi:hypothetical protein